MASVYGANYTNIFQTYPSVKVDVTDWHAKIRNVYDNYTQTAGAVLAVGDKVYMGRLPAGAKIVSAQLVANDWGATGVADVGYEYVNSADGSNVTNGIFSAVDIHTAALVSLMPSGATVQASWMLSGGFLGEVDLVITITTATDGVAVGSFKLAVQYVLE